MRAFNYLNNFIREAIKLTIPTNKNIIPIQNIIPVESEPLEPRNTIPIIIRNIAPIRVTSFPFPRLFIIR